MTEGRQGCNKYCMMQNLCKCEMFVRLLFFNLSFLGFNGLLEKIQNTKLQQPKEISHFHFWAKLLLSPLASYCTWRKWIQTSQFCKAPWRISYIGLCHPIVQLKERVHCMWNIPEPHYNTVLKMHAVKVPFCKVLLWLCWIW